MSLDNKVSASVDVVSRVAPGQYFRAIFISIVLIRAFSHCWEPYCELCG